MSNKYIPTTKRSIDSKIWKDPVKSWQDMCEIYKNLYEMRVPFGATFQMSCPPDPRDVAKAFIRRGILLEKDEKKKTSINPNAIVGSIIFDYFSDKGISECLRHTLDLAYTVEGFKLINGDKYLPDFLLPNVPFLFAEEPRTIFFEVKRMGGVDMEILKKFLNFAVSSQYALITCYGDPWLDTTLCYFKGFKDEKYYISECKFAQWKSGDRTETGIVVKDILTTLLSSEDLYWEAAKEKAIMNAYISARSARFEHETTTQ